MFLMSPPPGTDNSLEVQERPLIAPEAPRARNRGAAADQQEQRRSASYGQNAEPSLVDRFGVWLSSRRIRRALRGLDDIRIGDFGCGYNATIALQLLDRASHLVLIDVAVSAKLEDNPKVTTIEADLPMALERLESESLDVVVLNSVLEHLWDADWALSEARRVVKPGGLVLVNVPSWRGKRWLELSAFKLGMSPADEMDDHKAYYDPRDLWPLLVRAGFRPSNIKCRRHKFGLNTWAECRRS